METGKQDVPSKRLSLAEAFAGLPDPRVAARSPVQVSAERTAEDSLLNQLSIMNDRLERILSALVASKADKLVHHEQFIRLKR